MSRTTFAAGRLSPRSPTLGGGHAHVYVTRAATLAFQELRPGPFETTRRELTHLLLSAVPVPEDSRRYTLSVADAQLVAYVVPDGDLLVVASVSLAQDAQGAYSSGPPSRETCPCGDGTRPGHPLGWCGQGGPVPSVYSPEQLKQ